MSVGTVRRKIGISCARAFENAYQVWPIDAGENGTHREAGPCRDEKAGKAANYNRSELEYTDQKLLN